jgi:hypothetical protein
MLLADIADDLSNSDPALAEQLTDGEMAERACAAPAWAVHLTRVSIVTMPVVLLVPFEWWGAVVALAIPVVTFMLQRARCRDDPAAGREDGRP